MDRGLYNIVVLLDLKKSFDTVNHEILLRISNTKSQRKRGLNTSNSKPEDSLQINVPSDIGVVIAEEAKNVGQQLRISSQSAKCTNVHRAKESQSTVPNDPTSSPRNATALENNREVNHVELTGGIHSTSKQQNIPTDGIIMEQLAGIQGAMDVMENPEVNDEEENLSLLMNVIESEGLSSVLSDMARNLVR
ncbi:Hypothetical predicted protein [Paramuricea clavata]|uniref:Uncharacterized protein n=1 Tax=Paramuricea clavata TaxID=317549 RepID=A0A7D9E889_PARCT|nr:Hypothetical predicted protein [Paramuricea clavata]